MPHAGRGGETATTRTMTDGITEMEKTGNLVIATFHARHQPQPGPGAMHTHAVVANATLSQNGWKTSPLILTR
ncbi:relaxase domain-containing protein [Pantoea sp. LMR881]|nr:relaxase domain-containing protein [Pantoea sp. LMR881]MCZ4061150.1 relaxase domain-containing protein [Pantoea sp. LMR881]